MKDILDVVYNEMDHRNSLSVTWEAFLDPYHGIDFGIINQYALAVFVRPVETMLHGTAHKVDSPANR